MPTGLAHVPDDGSGLARRLRDIESQLRGVAAARRIAAAADQPWMDLPTGNGWAYAGGTWAPPQIRAQINGMAQLIGALAPGTLTPGTVIAALPFHPPGDLEWRVGGGATTASVDLTVTAAGALTVQATTGTVTRVSLNDIAFPIA